MEKIGIVGAGLVGTVLAVFLTRAGYEVHLFDARPAPRQVAAKNGVSINLSLSKRGLDALDAIGVGDAVRQQAVPGYGRLIHPSQGQPIYQPYGRNGECLYSISRKALHIILTDFAHQEAGCHFHFAEKCVDVDLDQASLCLQHVQSGLTRQVAFAHIFGADGVHSLVRQKMQRQLDIALSRTTLQHGYRELLASPAALIDNALPRDVVHLWPRGDFMLMGLPNLDGSTSLTLTMPFTGDISFATLTTLADYTHLFQSYFPDIAPALLPNLAGQLAHQVGQQVEIRCFPWIYRDKVALIGDACHAIFNFFAQGVNAGFEDCHILAHCLAQAKGDWATVLAAYQQQRKANTDAIADLAAHHFSLLREKVADPAHQQRQQLEQKISTLLPSYATLYHNVAFTNLPYREAQRLDLQNQQILEQLLHIEALPNRLDDPETERFLCHFVQERLLNPPLCFAHT